MRRAIGVIVLIATLPTRTLVAEAIALVKTAENIAVDAVVASTLERVCVNATRVTDTAGENVDGVVVGIAVGTPVPRVGSALGTFDGEFWTIVLQLVDPTEDVVFPASQIAQGN